MSSSLGFDWFIQAIHQNFSDLPDFRSASPRLKYSIKDAALGAFSMFFSQSPSFLSYQRVMSQAQGKSNASSLFKVDQVPTDNQIRNLLDPIPPSSLFHLFSDAFEALEEQGHLEEYRFFEDHFLLPLDGTDYFRSSKIRCENCSTTHHKNGKISYSHKVLTPVLVTPRNSKVLALAPEFITPQDGSKKQDCELNAAKRWVERNASLAEKKIIILGDDLFSRNPFCQLLISKGFRFILVCKPESHPTLYQEIERLEQNLDIPSFSLKKWNGRFKERTTYRYLNELPIKSGEEALKVNWVEVTVRNEKTQKILYKNSFITDFHLDSSTVPRIIQAGRARWKVENENNNVLKTKGYHLEHNFGHGKKHLSMTLLTLNLLAFLTHTCLGIIDQSYQSIREKLGPRKTFFQDFNTLTKYFYFKSWKHLMTFMAQELKIFNNSG